MYGFVIFEWIQLSDISFIFIYFTTLPPIRRSQQEAAIYDFQVDVLRIAVSVCSHAFTNGLDPKDVHDVLRAFTDMYVETLINYVGSDRELLYELTPRTASGSLKTFLTNLRDDKSGSQMLQKFTEKDKNGARSFIYGDKTHLVKVSAEVEQAIR